MKSLVLTAIAVLFGAFTVAAQERVLVLEGGTLIDGTGRPPMTDAVVVVQGNRITMVARRGQVKVPAGATVIQTNGRTILPGLIDTHVHLRDWHIPMFLPFGITTMGDIHNDTSWSLAQRALLKSGVIQGPRLFISGARVTGPEGEPVKNAEGQVLTDPSYVKDAAEARAYIRYLKAVGVDQVKVDATITDEQLAAVLDESRKVGLPVFGHTKNIKVAASFGMKHMEHTNTMARALLEQEGKFPPPQGKSGEEVVNPALFPGLIQYLVEQRVYVDPTLYGWMRAEHWTAARPLIERLTKDPGLGFVPPAMKTAWLSDPGRPRGGYDNVAKFLKQYSDAGGKILVSSDARDGRIPPGLVMHVEMQIMTSMGIPAMKAIQGATLWGAEMMGIEKDYGSVEAGKVADLVVIEGDPLANIAATQNVRTVIMDGKVVDTKYDPNWKNPLPRPKGAMDP